MQIDLSSEERTVLAELLRRNYQELREEIRKTDDSRFKAHLRTKERLIESLLAKFEPGGVARTA